MPVNPKRVLRHRNIFEVLEEVKGMMIAMIV
jgi:hypothetical protein